VRHVAVAIALCACKRETPAPAPRDAAVLDRVEQMIAIRNGVRDGHLRQLLANRVEVGRMWYPSCDGKPHVVADDAARDELARCFAQLKLREWIARNRADRIIAAVDQNLLVEIGWTGDRITVIGPVGADETKRDREYLTVSRGLPDPPFEASPAARAELGSGSGYGRDVTMLLCHDENGLVTSHRLLMPSRSKQFDAEAEAAAAKVTRFDPFLLDGKPVAACDLVGFD